MSSANGSRHDSMRSATCRICGTELKVYERPEGFCDDCLRSRQTQSLARVAKPETEANAGASRPKGGS